MSRHIYSDINEPSKLIQGFQGMSILTCPPFFFLFSFLRLLSVMPLDGQLVIGTKHPAAIQSVTWQDQKRESNTELISKIHWLKSKAPITQMVFDKPTNLLVWVSEDGKAYVVRRPEVCILFVLISHRGFRLARGGKDGYFMIMWTILRFTSVLMPDSH